MPLTRKLAAEFVGTLWLVLGGCGSAVLAAAFPHVGIGLLGVSLAFGLTVVTMAFAIGHVSGCHLNPAVTLGLVVGGRHPAKEILPYWIAQVAGAIVAAGVLVYIASGNGSNPLAAGLAAKDPATLGAIKRRLYAGTLAALRDTDSALDVGGVAPS